MKKGFIIRTSTNFSITLIDNIVQTSIEGNDTKDAGIIFVDLINKPNLGSLMRDYPQHEFKVMHGIDGLGVYARPSISLASSDNFFMQIYQMVFKIDEYKLDPVKGLYPILYARSGQSEKPYIFEHLWSSITSVNSFTFDDNVYPLEFTTSNGYRYLHNGRKLTQFSKDSLRLDDGIMECVYVHRDHVNLLQVARDMVLNEMRKARVGAVPNLTKIRQELDMKNKIMYIGDHIFAFELEPTINHCPVTYEKNDVKGNSIYTRRIIENRIVKINALI